MPYFPYPNVTNGFQDILTYGNTVTDNYFSISILIALFMIILLSMLVRRVQSERAFASAAFSTTLVSYIMILIPGFISPDIIVIMTLISALSVILLWRT